METFLDCARRYYREADDAKVGLWFDNADGLLERSDLHPPMKKKILPLLVANILQTDETTGQKFLDEIWRKQIKGRETVRASKRFARVWAEVSILPITQHSTEKSINYLEMRRTKNF